MKQTCTRVYLFLIGWFYVRCNLPIALDLTLENSNESFMCSRLAVLHPTTSSCIVHLLRPPTHICAKKYRNTRQQLLKIQDNTGQKLFKIQYNTGQKLFKNSTIQDKNCSKYSTIQDKNCSQYRTIQDSYVKIQDIIGHHRAIKLEKSIAIDRNGTRGQIEHQNQKHLNIPRTLTLLNIDHWSNHITI